MTTNESDGPDFGAEPCSYCGIVGGDGAVQTLTGEVRPCPVCNPRTARQRNADLSWLIPSRMASWDLAGLADLRGAGDSLATRLGNWLEQMIADDDHRRSSGMGGLYLYGRYGRGKTGAAVAILRAVQDRPDLDWTTAFCPVNDLAETMRASNSGDADGDRATRRVRNAREAMILVLDDLGAERSTEFVLEQLVRLIEYRRNSGYITIFTSNFSLDTLFNTWEQENGATLVSVQGERLISRLSEYCTLAAVTGETLRPSRKRGSDL